MVLLLLPLLLLRPHLRPARGMAFHFHLLPARATHFHPRLGSVILQLVVSLVTVKAGLPTGFPYPAMAKASRPVVAVVSFVAGSWPVFGRFASADLVIAAADPVFLAGPDLAAAVADSAGSPGSGSAFAVVAAAGLAVDSAATVFAAAGFGFAAVAADPACFFVGSVCPFAAETGKARVVVDISCSLTPRSSF